MDIQLTDLSLPMRHAFTISLGSTTTQHNLLVSLSQDGQTGYGEGASTHAYPEFDAPSMRAALELVCDKIQGMRLTGPEEFWDAMEPALGHNRFALCALDEAAHDLWGKLRGEPNWKIWGLDISKTPISNYTIGIDPIPKMIAKMKEFEGWPIYKIKLGTDHDLEIVRELRKHTEAAFRVDANTAWTAEQTLEFAPALKELGVEFIEQPLKRDDWEGMKKVFAESPLPVIADESCLVEADVARCAGYFHGINIKLTKAGGMTPAMRMIREARRLGLKVMIGCMNESSVGISAIGQLAPMLDYVDMDGAVLIAKDIATGVSLDHGRPVYPDASGNGVVLLTVS